jgi:exonuclease SbcC
MSSRYIEEVQLINFQDHADTTIKFTNGINLIVGSSDAGKSAVLRALNYVFHNSMKGDSFIRVGTAECSVRVKFSDGIEVTRIKGGDTNSYVLKDVEGNHHTYSKVGQTVPDPVRKALGSPPLDDKKKPISYADQMSSLFLVDLSPTDLPRTLSELTGIQNLQTAAELLQKNSRSFDRSIKEKIEKIDKLKVDLDNYSYVDKDLNKIQEIETKLEVIEQDNQKVKSSRAYIEANNEIAKEAKKIKEALSKDKIILDIKDKFDSLNESYQLFVKGKSYFQIHASKIKEYKKKKSEVDALELFLSEENKNNFILINDKLQKVNKSESYLEKNDSLMDSIETSETNITNEQNKVIKFKKILNELKKKLQASGNWCDACDRPLIENE